MTEAVQIRAITSRSEFRQAVREAIAGAAAAGAAELVFVDADFDDWPIDERGVVEALADWADSSRRLVVIGVSFETLARRAPRFVEWRRQWSHIVSCRSPDEVEAEQIPTLLLVEGTLAIRLDDPVWHRGTVSERPVERVAAREAIDALLQRSVEAFPATTLGL